MVEDKEFPSLGSSITAFDPDPSFIGVPIAPSVQAISQKPEAESSSATKTASVFKFDSDLSVPTSSVVTSPSITPAKPPAVIKS